MVQNSRRSPVIKIQESSGLDVRTRGRTLETLHHRDLLLGQQVVAIDDVGMLMIARALRLISLRQEALPLIAPGEPYSLRADIGFP